MGKGSRGAGRRGQTGHTSTSAQSQQNAAPQQQQQSSQSGREQPRRSAAFTLDDPDTWFDFLQQSVNPFTDFRDVLEQRYAVPLSALLPAEVMPCVAETLDEVTTTAVTLLHAASQDEFKIALKACKKSYKALKRRDRECRQAVSCMEEVLLFLAQPESRSQKEHRWRIQSSVGFSADDPDTWWDFLGLTDFPGRDMRSALEERFVTPLNALRPAEEVQTMTAILDDLARMAVNLLLAESEDQYQIYLMECKAVCKKLKCSERKTRKEHTSVRPREEVSGQNQAPSKQQQQQQAPSLTAAQPSQPSTQLDTAFSVDDLSTWAEFLRKSKSPYQDLHDALTQRFDLPCTKAPTQEQRNWVANTLLSLCSDAMRLLHAASQKEVKFNLRKCQALFNALKDLDDRLKKKSTKRSAPRPKSAQQQPPSQKPPQSLITNTAASPLCSPPAARCSDASCPPAAGNDDDDWVSAREGVWEEEEQTGSEEEEEVDAEQGDEEEREDESENNDNDEDASLGLEESRTALESVRATFAQREVEALQMQMAAASAGLFPTQPEGNRASTAAKKWWWWWRGN